jgi:predicted HicB family RNase H-like nuclease
MVTKVGSKKVIFEIDVKLHCDIKAAAAKKNISMSYLINKILIEYIKNETKYDKIPEENNKTNN